MLQGLVFSVFPGDLLHDRQRTGIIFFIFQADCFIEPEVSEGAAYQGGLLLRQAFRQELLVRKSLSLPEHFLSPGVISGLKIVFSDAEAEPLFIKTTIGRPRTIVFSALALMERDS